ncbi:hypothetical protein EJB05_48526, partial [Eragrostis curvula]
MACLSPLATPGHGSDPPPASSPELVTEMLPPRVREQVPCPNQRIGYSVASVERCGARDRGGSKIEWPPLLELGGPDSEGRIRHPSKVRPHPPLENSPGICGVVPERAGGDADLGFRFPPPVPPLPPNRTTTRYFGHFWGKGCWSGENGVTRSFAQVVRSRSAPVVMVAGMESRGWGRDGFGAGRQGRGVGRTAGRQDYTWRREQEWVKKDEGQNPDRGTDFPDRDRWERRDLDVEEKKIEEMQIEEVKEKSKWSHREEMMEGKRQWSYQEEGSSKQIEHKRGEVSSSSSIPNPPLIECYRCGDKGHVAQNCTKPRRCDRCGSFNHVTEHCKSKKLWEYVAPLCATQVEGQSFFCIPDCPSDNTLKERSNTAIVTVVSGEVTARQLELEFKSILSGNVWRWTARPAGPNKFTVRFPNSQLIKDWGHFKPLGMRTTNAQIAIDPWNPSIGAKAEMQQAWFRVRGIPFDKRSALTLAYVGSLVGATTEIDEKSLSRLDYVRMKICCRDVTLVPPSAEGAIIPYMYTFFYEREINIPIQNPTETSQIHVSSSEPSPKKPRTEQGGKSAPAKMYGKNCTGKIQYDAQKGYSREGSEKEKVKAVIPDVENNMEENVEVNSTDTDDDDDLLSEEFGIDFGKGEEASSSKQQVGLVKCAEISPLKPDVMGDILGQSTNLPQVQDEDHDDNDRTMDKQKAVEDSITEAQKITITRQSERLQQQLLQVYNNEPPKKRNLEGTNLNDHNSFSVLSNPEISLIASNMGIVVNLDQFDTIDLMKDLEVARHAIKNKKDNEANPENVEVIEMQADSGPNSGMPLLLEWENEDSEEESFTLVTSRKKKRNLMEKERNL